MKKSQYWSVKLNHSRMQYNDIDEFSIINGNGSVIVTLPSGREDSLMRICNAHNQCFFEEDKND